ncbi:hypothetical protein DM02DRAFT_628345 [Periconia macrospinosa]|uniref:Uncharacterized protein n=1 Tax=Periconia macrospinosa TaxID=97972 RepID=A0A2V1DR87_9PLEO|nr:hypothetical protein DM02DRAFT_628345 [Periconia macrospinosa]
MCTEHVPKLCMYHVPQRSEGLDRFMYRPPSAPDGTPPNEVITIQQVGSPSQDVERTSHAVLVDKHFGHAMLGQLEISLQRVSENWESWRASASFSLLARRACLSISGDLFKENGFETVENKRMEIRKELRNVMSTSLLLIHDHIARKAVINGKMIGTDKDWAEVWAKAGEEIEQGVSLTMDMVVAVGRKPLLTE